MGARRRSWTVTVHEPPVGSGAWRAPTYNGSLMAIERERVEHVARLARLDLREDEIERLTRELGAILEAVSKVAELDLVNVWAEDEPHVSLPVDDALANAPVREGDLFRVPPTA